MTHRRIPSLDGLRAISIAMVIGSHVAHRGGGPSSWAASVLVNGHLGVSVFFAVSGYLITRLLMREMEGTGRIDLRAFYARRVLRIFPAFYSYMLIIRALAWVGLIVAPRETWISSALFLRDYVAPPSRPPEDWYTAHIWSLSIEEQFYLLWPVTLALVGVRRGRWVAAGLIAAAPFLRLAMYLAVPSLRTGADWTLHARIDTLMMGCLAALLGDSQGFLRSIRKSYRSGLPLACATFLLFGDGPLWEMYGGRYKLTVGYGLDAACIVMVVLWCVDRPDGQVGRLLNSRPVARVGVLSYSLYLWQQPCTKWLAFPWSVVASLALAELSYRFVERPFLNRGRIDPASIPNRHRSNPVGG